MTTTKTDAAPTTATPRANNTGHTSYVILEALPEGAYRLVDTVSEKNAELALKATVVKSGTYVAVPARSMVPVLVKVATVTQVTVG